MTIIQTHMEVNVLTNKINAPPELPQYTAENNHAPLCRSIVGGLLDRIEHADGAANGMQDQSSLSSNDIVSLYPKLASQMITDMLAETVHAITAIGGHENPPARHIVGHEAVASVKEKLKTVSEELEDFVEVSTAVDIDGEDESPPAETRSNGTQ